MSHSLKKKDDKLSRKDDVKTLEERIHLKDGPRNERFKKKKKCHLETVFYASYRVC